MQIKDCVAMRLRAYKAAHRMSLMDMSEELEIAKSSLQMYLRGTENLRTDTIEQLARKMELSPAELVSEPSPGQEKTVEILRAAQLLGTLPPEKREEGTRLFLALAELFSV